MGHALVNRVVFWSITLYVGVQDSSRLARVCREFAQAWQYVCNHRLLPMILRWYRGMAIRHQWPRPWPTLRGTNDDIQCIAETIRCGVSMTRADLRTLHKLAPITTVSPASMRLLTNTTHDIATQSALILAASHHGPRVQYAVRILLDDGLGSDVSDALQSKAKQGCFHAVAAVLMAWTTKYAQWPSFPIAIFQSSLHQAEHAVGVARVETAAAVLAYTVFGTFFCFRIALPDVRHVTPPVIPTHSQGLDQAWAFLVANGPYFDSTAIDAIVHRDAYEHDAQRGNIVGTTSERDAWICADRYLQRQIVLPPPLHPSFVPGGSLGIGPAAWLQTALSAPYATGASDIFKHVTHRQWQTFRRPNGICVQMPFPGYTAMWDALPQLWFACAPKLAGVSIGVATGKHAKTIIFGTIQQRNIDQAWIIKWTPAALAVSSGPITFRCRILRNLLQQNITTTLKQLSQCFDCGKPLLSQSSILHGRGPACYRRKRKRELQLQ